MEEKRIFYMSDYVGIASLLVILVVGIGLFIYGANHTNGALVVLGITLPVGVILFLSSLTIVSPNQAKAILFFGCYLDMIKGNELFIIIPFTQKMNIFLKVRSFNGSLLKVNDSNGSPIGISAVIVSRIADTAKVLFNVDYYQDFVEIQSEAAIRYVVTQYPCDTFSDNDITLRRNTRQISEELTKELQERLAVAGVEVTETRLDHLAYATEIANSMLQRRQAKTILAAQQTVVEGMVSMTQVALGQIEEGQEINFTDGRKVQPINNLLVSIITDRGTQLVINTGSVSSQRESNVKNNKKESSFR